MVRTMIIPTGFDPSCLPTLFMSLSPAPQIDPSLLKWSVENFVKLQNRQKARDVGVKVQAG